MNDKFLFALFDKNVYYFDKIDTTRVNIAFTKKNIGFFKRKIRRINWFCVKNFSWLPGFKFINKTICRRMYDKRIVDAITKNSGLAILDSNVYVDLLYLMKSFKADKCFFLIWNALDDAKVKYYTKYLNKKNIYSYSKNDCEKYGLNYFNDFYLMDYPAKNLPVKYDFYFLGQDKGRTQALSDFIELIKDGSYSFRFDIYKKDGEEVENFNPNFNYFSEYMSFDDYLLNVFQCRCLVDFSSSANISFRTLEAIIFKKKYITNFAAIRERDFYNSNNIFIVDPDTTIEEIKEFLEKPLVEIPVSIKKRYDFYEIYNYFKGLSER